MRGNPLTAEFLGTCARLSAYEQCMASIAWHIAPVYFSHKPSALINLGKLEKLSEHGSLHCAEDSSGFFSNAEIKDVMLHMGSYYDNDLKFTIINGISSSIHLFCCYPERIRAICQDYEVRCFLENMGYKSFEPEDCIQRLRQRFRIDGSFPHEIGIFLGYPFEDVIAFIKNKGRNYLLNGYWKVYSNVTRAIEIFMEYDNARKQMLQKWSLHK
ncbi:MAG TPA: DUF3793 family protein [Clostridiales bacterium]|nr:DUF3793 family protein [Clostridiales bacterium]